MSLSPETLLAMNQRLIAIYEKKPLSIHIGKMTKRQVKRERDKFLTELRTEKLNKQLNLR